MAASNKGAALRRLRVGGVPEHFNWPWHRAIANGALAAHGLEVEWKTFPGGSGAMAAALKNDEIDVACMLTEAVLAEVYKGAPMRLLGFYVKSPLIWGIHAKAGVTRASWDETAEPTVAISRFGSGSHLMALVDARVRGKSAPSKWEVVGSMDGARKALAVDETAVFFWEKFTTKPHVDSGEWERLDVCPTPWPCFALAASDAALQRDDGAILEVLAVVAAEAAKLKAEPEAALDELVREYSLKRPDLAEWFSDVEWSCKPHAPKGTIDKVAAALVDAKVLEQSHLDTKQYADLVSSYTLDKPL